MTKSDLIRDFISKTKLTEKKAIARELHKKYPDKFKSVEEARRDVRYITGAAGERKRKAVVDPQKSKFFYNGFEKFAEENLNVDLAPWDEPFQIPYFKKLNVIADLHSVHLDPKVMTKFLKSTKDKTALIINGDLIDSENLSQHLKGHNLIEYDKELDLCHQILKGLKEEFDHVYFKEGNHDFWLERYLLTNAREIFRLRGVGLKELLRLGELGVHHIHNLKYWTFGDLDAVHGHEFPGFGMGKFPATGLIDKWQSFKGKYDVKILCSHAHRADHTVSKKSKDGKFGYGWVTPAFCRKGAQYNPYAGWNNGWVELNNEEGVVTVDMKIV